MSADNNLWSVSCQIGGCDFTKSGATAEAANKAAESHTRDQGHPTITEHTPGGVSQSAQIDAQEAKNALPVEAAAPAKAKPAPAKATAKAVPAKKAPAKKAVKR